MQLVCRPSPNVGELAPALVSAWRTFAGIIRRRWSAFAQCSSISTQRQRSYDDMPPWPPRDDRQGETVDGRASFRRTCPDHPNKQSMSAVGAAAGATDFHLRSGSCTNPRQRPSLIRRGLRSGPSHPAALVVILSRSPLITPPDDAPHEMGDVPYSHPRRSTGSSRGTPRPAPLRRLLNIEDHFTDPLRKLRWHRVPNLQRHCFDAAEEAGIRPEPLQERRLPNRQTPALLRVGEPSP